MDNKLYLKTLLITSSLALAPSSFAQHTDIVAEASTPGNQSQKSRVDAIEEVLVTARRVQESQQDVPIAITAMSSDQLEREIITTAMDLQGRIPSLVMTNNSQMRSTEVAAIRGMLGNFQTPPGVVMYYADVPLPVDSFMNNQGGPGMFFDLRNIQVLKGPQGTLFGRNTTGGAFVMDPTRPTEEFELKLQIETGNYDNEAYEAVINMPLISDKVLIRVGYKTVERRGFTKDLTLDRYVDDCNYWTSRFGLTLRPTDPIENTVLLYQSERDENGTGFLLDDINSEGFNAAILNAFLGVPPLPLVPPQLQAGCLAFNVFSGSTNCGQDVAAAAQARDNRTAAFSVETADRLKTSSIINTFSWELTDWVTLRSITSKAYYERRLGWDQDGGPVGLNDVRPDATSTDVSQFTQELQLIGTMLNEHLDYAVGLYYQSAKPEGPQVNNTTALFQEVQQTSQIESESIAPYFQATYNLGHVSQSLADLNFTGGIRHTTDKVVGEATLDFAGNLNEVQGSEKESAITWTLGLGSSEKFVGKT